MPAITPCLWFDDEAHAAMLRMKKIDVAAIERARNGDRT